jgi:hypothetical protein
MAYQFILGRWGQLRKVTFVYGIAGKSGVKVWRDRAHKGFDDCIYVERSKSENESIHSGNYTAKSNLCGIKFDMHIKCMCDKTLVRQLDNRWSRLCSSLCLMQEKLAALCGVPDILRT